MFTDALQDAVTISTTSLSVDSIGQQSKEFTELYSEIPCRLQSASGFSQMQQAQGNFQQVVDKWLILVEAKYNGASKGDKAVINGETYIITKKHDIRGDSSEIHHTVYYLQEKV